MEQVDSYCYLDALVTAKLSWTDHINLIWSKARKLVRMLNRQFFPRVDTGEVATPPVYADI